MGKPKKAEKKPPKVPKGSDEHGKSMGIVETPQKPDPKPDPSPPTASNSSTSTEAGTATSKTTTETRRKKPRHTSSKQSRKFINGIAWD